MLGYNTWQFKMVVLLVSSLTAVFAGFLHTIHQPIVSPHVAGLGWTVAALLIILIGGVGTLTGRWWVRPSFVCSNTFWTVILVTQPTSC